MYKEELELDEKPQPSAYDRMRRNMHPRGTKAHGDADYYKKRYGDVGSKDINVINKVFILIVIYLICFLNHLHLNLYQQNHQTFYQYKI